MILALRNIGQGHSEQTQTVILNEENRPKAPTAGPVVCHAQIDRAADHIYIKLDYKTDVAFECSRCLKPFEFILEDSFTVICKESGTSDTPPDQEDDVDFYFNGQTEEIDIQAALADEISAALPLGPLCKTDCRGITLKAHTGEAAGSKSEAKKSDPRWNALAILKNTLQK